MLVSESTRSLIRLALQEDIGRGDCTSDALIDENVQAHATVSVKQEATLAGLSLIGAVFAELDPRVRVQTRQCDGANIPAHTVVCELEGPARSLLTGERTALNFLARLSGIATGTRAAVSELDGTHAKLLDTRKTTPGWRVLEKYAVRIGGGHNHRFGLDDMILIKDNHIALCGSIAKAVARARQYIGLSQKIEVEVETLAQLREALKTQADMILLDNMSLDLLREAVSITRGALPLEASGNVHIETLAEIARTGVDYISMGALTHGAASVDVSLDIAYR